MFFTFFLKLYSSLSNNKVHGILYIEKICVLYSLDEKNSLVDRYQFIIFGLNLIQSITLRSNIFKFLDQIGGVGFNQHCHKISTVLHHIGFRSTSLLLFTLNIFNISTVFTLNELSSPLFFHQHGFQSTLFSLNTAYHLH